MINSRLAVAVHILALTAIYPREQLTSEYIAGSVNTNPVVIRRMTGMLKKAGLLKSDVGVPGAALTKEPAEISLLDVYIAVRKDEELFAVHENPNPKCPVGAKIQSTLDDTFSSVQKAMENELASKSLDDMLEHLFV